MTAMTQEERIAALERVFEAVGMKLTGDRPGGQPGLVTDRPRLAIEEEIYQIQGQYGYGEVWGRPGLSIKQRSFLTVALLTALGRPDELRHHIGVALHLGITPEEIHEILLHTGVYAGLPFWNSAANIAREVFQERGVLAKD